MGLLKKKEGQGTPLQEAVRELERIDEIVEDGTADEQEREDLLARRRELVERIAEMRGEPTTTEPPDGQADDQLSSFR